ncbi:hypothetical protein AB4267_02240 [Vibrio cyclitrophicus]|uniref:Uncharacterized protein n=1 Tax=Vibrio pelagius TaxID=28169 RepID=A0ABY5G2C7_VIBPE|nr:hypothetical protein [Vibrio pelagius]UTT84289.1 hypothetical protein LZI70_11465 [Vibrio pelagius]
MSQLARQQEMQPSSLKERAPSAAESIAACKSLFDKSAKRRKLRDMYNEMSDRSRGLILIAGGMPPKDYSREFDSFDDLELQKVRSGMQLLKEMVMKFDRKVGDVRRLKHSDISKVN